MILSPNVEVDKHPGLHQPHTVLITFLNGLDHSLTAGAEVFGFHGLGLFIRSNNKANIHLHEQITIVEVRSVTVEIGGVKKQIELNGKDIVALG